MYRLGEAIGNRVDVLHLASPVLERIVEKADETCAPGLLREPDYSLVFAAQAEVAQPLRYSVPLNEPISILWGGSARSRSDRCVSLLIITSHQEVLRRSVESTQYASDRYGTLYCDFLMVPSRSAWRIRKVRVRAQSVRH